MELPKSGIAGHGQTTVGASAVQMGALECQSVLLKAPASNTGNVFIGNSSAVTASTGFILGPGDAIEVGVGNLNLIYAIASTADQKLHYITINRAPI